MKKILFSIGVAGVLLASCDKKDDATATPTTGGGGGSSTPTTSYIATDSIVDGTQDSTKTVVRKFDYNSDNKIVKVWKKYPPSTTFIDWDIFTYNASGKLEKIVEYSNSIAIDSTMITYNGDYVASVIGASKKDTAIFTFVNGKISSIVISEQKDTAKWETATVNGFTFDTNGGITELNYGGMGITTVPTTVANPYYANFASDDWFDLASPFVLSEVSQKDSVPKKLISEIAYTLDASGRAETLTEKEYSFEDGSLKGTIVRTITYKP